VTLCYSRCEISVFGFFEDAENRFCHRLAARVGGLSGRTSQLGPDADIGRGIAPGCGSVCANPRHIGIGDVSVDMALFHLVQVVNRKESAEGQGGIRRPANAHWDKSKPTSWNFNHTSRVREGIYPGDLRGDHRGRAGEVQWHLELVGTPGRQAIEMHVGNALIRDSEGCALCGEAVHVGRGIEPRLSGSTHAVNRFVQAIFGDTSKVQNPSQWASMMHDLKITVHIIGMPPGAWKVN
jgi:Family of unknown function (DUF5675)